MKIIISIFITTTLTFLISKPVVIVEQTLIEPVEHAEKIKVDIPPVEEEKPILSQPEPSYSVNRGCDAYAKELGQYAWDLSTAKKICQCESSGNPEAHNYNPNTGDDSYGLFQINLYGSLANNRPSGKWLSNPSNNIAYAYEMYANQGWTPWSCYRKI